MAWICSSKLTSKLFGNVLYILLWVSAGQICALLDTYFLFCVATVLYLTFGSIAKNFAYFRSWRLWLRTSSVILARKAFNIKTSTFNNELNVWLNLLSILLWIKCVHFDRSSFKTGWVFFETRFDQKPMQPIYVSSFIVDIRQHSHV